MNLEQEQKAMSRRQAAKQARIPWKKGKAKPTRVTKDGRLILSPGDWRKMKLALWERQPRPLCGICNRVIECFEDFEPDHIRSRGMGGGYRDDRPFNIQPSHKLCNSKKGSRRI